MKPVNKVERLSQSEAAEPVEPRASAERNPHAPPKVKTQSLTGLADGMKRIGAKARQEKALRFNNLLNHITVTRLWH